MQTTKGTVKIGKNSEAYREFVEALEVGDEVRVLTGPMLHEKVATVEWVGEPGHGIGKIVLVAGLYWPSVYILGGWSADCLQPVLT